MTRSRILVAAVLALLAAAAAVPRFGPCCVMRNDLGAWATLRSIGSAQSELREAKRIDTDRDGTGEFGYLAELSGRAALPGGDRALSTPYLGTAFRVVRPDGAVARAGYRFRVFLPAADGTGVREPGTPAMLARPG